MWCGVVGECRRTFGGSTADNHSRWTANMDGLTGIETDTDGMKRGDSTRVKGEIAGN